MTKNGSLSIFECKSSSFYLKNYDFRLRRCCPSEFDDDESKVEAFKWWMNALDFHRVEVEDFPGPYKFAFFHPDMKQHDISAFHRLVGKKNTNNNRVDQAKTILSPIFNENAPEKFPENDKISENSVSKKKKHSKTPSLITSSQINTRLND